MKQVELGELPRKSVEAMHLDPSRQASRHWGREGEKEKKNGMGKKLVWVLI